MAGLSTRKWIGAALALLVTAGVVAQGNERTPAFRGFWADAFHSGFKSHSQINALVARAQTGNYNAIIAEVLAYQDTGPGGHGAYWNSSLVPKASDISAGFDPLAVLVNAAHAADIEVHAWIVPFRASTSWPPSGNATLVAHPEWFMVPIDDMGSGPSEVAGYYTLDPGSPDVQQYLVDIVRELVSNYDIDGINLDYIRYVQVDAGYPADETYAKSSLARFRELEWYSGTPPPTGFTPWNDFRRQTISELVRRLHVEIPQITGNPRQPVALTADLITWGNAPSNFIYSDAYALHQDFQHWFAQGWLDAGIPMNYKREHDGAQAAWYRNWVNAVIGMANGRHVYCGQGNYLNSKANSVTQLSYCLGVGADGTCNYSYYGTADENLDGNWENDWTWYNYVSANLFTTSVPLPAMPWRDPATATEGVVWGRAADPVTDAPIDGALVQLGGVGAARTDGNGYYAITRVPAAPAGTNYVLTADMWDCAQITVDDVVALPGSFVRVDLDLCSSQILGDMNQDTAIDMDDLWELLFCLQGPGHTFVEGNMCLRGDFDEDDGIDLADLAGFQVVFESR